MRSMLRALVMSAALTLAAFGLAPAAAAAQPRTVTVDDFAAYEGEWGCTAESPFTCSEDPGQLQFQIHMSPSPKTAVTLGWSLEDITATAGQDYTGPTSGTVTFPANGYVTYVDVPLVIDNVAEPNETVRFHITSSSISADISDTAVGTIWDGAQVPADCTVSQTAFNNMFMTCTGRPPTQNWHLQAGCVNLRGENDTNGTEVTGDGTSSVASCGGYAYFPYFVADS